MPAVLTLAVLTAACFRQDLPVVEVARVSSASVTETVSAPARVEAAARQGVTASVPGVVSTVRARTGERVTAGQPVVRLRSPQVEQALRRAEQARVAAARGVGGAENGVAAVPDLPSAAPTSVTVPLPGGAALAASEDAVAELDAEVRPALKDARKALRDVEDPQERRAVARAVDAIATAYHVVRTALLAGGEATAEQQNALARSVGVTLNDALAQAAAAQRAQAQAVAAAVEAQADALAAAGQAQAAAAATAARAQADAALEAARAQQQGLVLSAPFDGIVQLGGSSSSGGALAGGLPGQLDDLAGGLGAGGLDPGGDAAEPLRAGARVAPGQTVFTVYDLSTLYVEAQVDEVDVPQLAEGQRARVLIDAFPDTEYEGVVESVAFEASVSPAGGVAYPVRVRLFDPPPDATPRIGMTASAEIVTQQVDADLTVPSRAIVRRNDRTAVYAVRDGRVAIVPVEVVALGLDLAAVRGELSDDDRVVVSGYEDLGDGDEVSVR